MLGSKNYYYIIIIKNILDIISLTLWYLINFFIKKIYSINSHLKIFIIEGNMIKNLIKKGFIDC